MVTSHLQQFGFLNQLEANFVELGPDASEAEKNAKLQQLLLFVWKDVLKSFGFLGDEGYVQFQAALIEHSSDPAIATMIQSALMAVSARTKLRR